MRTIILFTSIFICLNHIAQSNSIDSVKVISSFIIEIDGEMTHFKLKCKECSKKDKEMYGNEIKRIISCAEWEHSKKRVKYVLPVTFKLEN